MRQFDKIAIIESIERKLLNVTVGTYSVGNSREEIVESVTNLKDVLKEAKGIIDAANLSLEVISFQDAEKQLEQGLNSIVTKFKFEDNLHDFRPVIKEIGPLGQVWNIKNLKDIYITFPGEDTEIHFDFMSKGAFVNEGELERNVALFDVGNALGVGVLDHHKLSEEQGRSYPCATTMVRKRKELILENIDENASKIKFVIHHNPDLDCFGSVLLARELVLKGEFPENYEQLVRFVEKADTGRLTLKPDQLNSIYAVACAIPFLIDEPNPDVKDRRIFDRGMELVEYAMERIKSVDGLELESPIFFPEDNPFKKEIDLLKNDYLKYKAFMEKEGNVVTGMVKLPTFEHNKAKIVKALITNESPDGIIAFKDWARGEGYVYTSITDYKDKEVAFSNGEKHKTSYGLILVNPDAGVDLWHVARELEKKECEIENELLPEGARRSGAPRFDWSKNSDPFYESADQTKIACPARGSLMSIEQVNDLALRYFQKQTRFMEIIEPSRKEDAFGGKLLSCLADAKKGKEIVNGVEKECVQIKF